MDEGVGLGSLEGDLGNLGIWRREGVWGGYKEMLEKGRRVGRGGGC